MSSAYRDVCIATSGDECVVCGDADEIVAHHVDGDRSNNDADNLVPMCPSCHRSVHQNSDGFEEWHAKLNEEAQREYSGNVKKDRDGRMFYLQDEVITELDDEFSRLRYECDFEVKKDRHYYPLIVALGLEELSRMSEGDVAKSLDRLEKMEGDNDE